MKTLITCGSPRIPIDRVRNIGNIFHGRTGFEIAKAMSLRWENHIPIRDNIVELLSSNSDHVKFQKESDIYPNLKVIKYNTFKDLKTSMKLLIKNDVDIVIHSSAVNDYKADGIYTKIHNGTLIRLPYASKVKSNHKELFLKMIQTEKIIDLIRLNWGFKGILVKFKLEVGKSDEELIQIAIKSKEHSKADIIVANCLEWMNERAIIITPTNHITIDRKDLPLYLYGEILKLTKYKPLNMKEIDI